MFYLLLLLSISSIIGCFPVKVSLFEHPKRLKFKWTHPMTWYNILILIFDLLITVDSRGYPTFCEIAFASKNSLKIITGYVENFNNLSSDRFIRIYAFFSSSQTVKLVQLIQSLTTFTRKYERKSEEDQEKMSSSAEDFERGRPVMDCCNPNAIKIGHGLEQLTLKSCVTVVFEKIKRLKALIMSWRSRVGLSKRYILMSINFFLHFTNHMFIMCTALQQRDHFILDQRFFFLPHREWVPKFVFVANNILIMTAQFFNLIKMVMLAKEMAKLIRSFKIILLQRLVVASELSGSEATSHERRGSSSEKAVVVTLGWNSDVNQFSYNRQRVDEDKFKNTFIEQFKELKQCCELFSDSHGFYALVNIGSVILSLGQFAFIFANSADIVYFSRSISCVLWIYATISVGEGFERECQKAREEIQDVLMARSDVRVNEELREMAIWVSNWSCKITAKNIFTVNMRLIPGVIGTVMTYVIFLFQLTMSEKVKMGA